MAHWLVVKLIRFYQLVFSPYIGMNCRFEPTCSNYAIECFLRFGFFRACYLTLYRVLRCSPFSRGGSDPVP